MSCRHTALITDVCYWVWTLRGLWKSELLSPGLHASILTHWVILTGLQLIFKVGVRMIFKHSVEIWKVYLASKGLKESRWKDCPKPGTTLVYNTFFILCDHSVIWELLSGVFFLTGFSADIPGRCFLCKGNNVLQEGWEIIATQRALEAGHRCLAGFFLEMRKVCSEGHIRCLQCTVLMLLESGHTSKSLMASRVSRGFSSQWPQWTFIPLQFWKPNF